MKLTIPEEYRAHFISGAVFVSGLRKSEILLMNEAENDNLAQIVEGTCINYTDGIVRFIRAGIIELDIENGELDIPDELGERLVGNDRTFSQQKLGIVVL